MRTAQRLEPTKENMAAIADFYEYSMAHANQIEGIAGKESVFDFVVRDMPTNKVIGQFMHEDVKYDKLEKRKYLVNAGLEQCAAYILNARGSRQIREYFEDVMHITDKRFLDWTEHFWFRGDMYAMPEGTIFFAQESQLRLHGTFEEAQVYESIILSTLNPQTNVATTANDIAQLTDKILLEGGSRRAGSPQGALFNSRAARIGGFDFSSNIAYAMASGEKVGGTHGHSYVMLHPTEYAAFKAQAETFRNNVCFLLDTYNVKDALETAMEIVQEDGLSHFAFRIDSGNLLEQARFIHGRMKEIGYARGAYTLVASDDLNAARIMHLEENGADIDKYLLGTFVVNPPKPVPGVYKLAAFSDAGKWVYRGKLSEEFTKSTLPGIKQIYRVIGEDGYFKKDIIAFEDEDISSYLENTDKTERLLVPIIRNGMLDYGFPSVDKISKRREEQLRHFKDINNYDVIISEGVTAMQQQIMQEHGFNDRLYSDETAGQKIGYGR